MKIHKYLALCYNPSGILVDTGDQETLDMIGSAIKEKCPNVRTTTNQYSKIDGSTIFDELDGKDVAIGRWLRELLLLKGWEIFAISPPLFIKNNVSSSQTYHFKLEYNIDQYL